MSDPNFLRNMLSGLPGVDANDEKIQKALRDLVDVRLSCSASFSHSRTEARREGQKVKCAWFLVLMLKAHTG